MGSRRGTGLTLAERAALSKKPTAAATPPPAPPSPDEPPSEPWARAIVQRHCWVLDLPDCPGRWAGLLLEWGRGDTGWRGRVVYAVTDGGQCILVQAWVDAAYLRPA